MTDVALLCREECGSRRDNDIHFQLDELGSDPDEPLVASLRPAILDRDGATLDPTKVAQSLHHSVSNMARFPPLASGGCPWPAVAQPDSAVALGRNVYPQNLIRRTIIEYSMSEA
jgi:hypothetical protein